MVILENGMDKKRKGMGVDHTKLRSRKIFYKGGKKSGVPRKGKDWRPFPPRRRGTLEGSHCLGLGGLCYLRGPNSTEIRKPTPYEKR